MSTYPLPTPNPDNIIQHERSKEDQQRLAISYLASEAALHSTYESYLDAINSNSLKSVPPPNAENLAILLEAKYGTVKDFWEAVAADEEGDLIAPPELFMLIPPHERSDIDTMRVELVQTNGPPGMTITRPEDMLAYAKRMSDYDREHMKVFHLDSANRIIGIENISTGTLNSTTAHPREVIKGAILNNSAGVIIAHNHPSGATTPSEADKRVAQGLINAFALLDIKVLDFVIMANDTVKSFSDDGIMPTVSPFVREMGSESEHGDACSVAYQAALEVMGEKCGRDN